MKNWSLLPSEIFLSLWECWWSAVHSRYDFTDEHCVGRAETHVKLISSKLDQEMNRWPDGRIFFIFSEWTRRAAKVICCCPQTVSKIAFTLILLDNERGWGRLSRSLPKLEESQQIDSHLKGNCQQLRTCEHSPASVHVEVSADE